MGSERKPTTPEEDEAKLALTPEEEKAFILERSEYLLQHISNQEQQLSLQEAKHSEDTLTGLKNRGVFEFQLKQSLKIIRGDIKEKREKEFREISLISIDIDWFKQINDTFGHPVGDEVLRKIAALLIKSVRGTDVVARVGGEEMMVLMRGANVHAAKRHAEELREEIEKLEFKEFPELKVTASFGIASSESSTIAKTLYENVDKALYVAKRSGRNQVAVF